MILTYWRLRYHYLNHLLVNQQYLTSLLVNIVTIVGSIRMMIFLEFRIIPMSNAMGLLQELLQSNEP